MAEDLPYTLQQTATLSGHEDRAWGVAWNPAKALLATCSADKTVRIYTYDGDGTPKFVLLTSIPTGHTKTVRSVAWSPSGTSLATGSFDSNIGIFQREGGDEGGGSGEWECMSMLEGHETECKSVAWSAGGNLLASCSRDKTVWVWEALPDADFECMGVLMEHSQDVKCVAWHPSEEILASASYDDTVKLYLDDPAEDWFCFATLTGHTSTVWAIAWSPNGQYLASASDDRTIRLWKRVEEHKWTCVKVIEEGHERTIYSISWAAKPGDTGEQTLGWLASAGGDGRINIWELEEEEGATAQTAPQHRLIARLENAHGVSDVNSVVWSPREGHRDLLASVGDDGEARIWKIAPI